ncbi:hypothetical protein JCM10212_002925 [Sporobolomyces blumeae]
MTGPERPARSQFLKKLHSILENPTHPNGLRWIGPDTFEISIADDVAIAALRPAFEFRSLGSFVRQLSYYNFKRLSDRRRSAERGTARRGYIKFTHASGYFVRGDASQLSRITRRPRTSRPRRASTMASNMSTTSDNESPSWPAQGLPVDYFENGSPDTAHPAMPFHMPFYPVPGTTCTPEFIARWKSYKPATASWSDPLPSPNGPPVDRQRRASTGVTDYPSPHEQAYPQALPFSQASVSAPAPGFTLPRIPESRPQPRQSYTMPTLPTISSLPSLPSPTEPGAGPSSQPLGGGGGFRAPLYPTPTFCPSTNTFFTESSYAAPGPSYAQHGVYMSLPDQAQPALSPHDLRPFPHNLKALPTLFNTGAHYVDANQQAQTSLPSPVTAGSPYGSPSDPSHSPNVGPSQPAPEPTMAVPPFDVGAPVGGPPSPHYAYVQQQAPFHAAGDMSPGQVSPSQAMPAGADQGYFVASHYPGQAAIAHRATLHGALWSPHSDV